MERGSKQPSTVPNAHIESVGDALAVWIIIVVRLSAALAPLQHMLNNGLGQGMVKKHESLTTVTANDSRLIEVRAGVGEPLVTASPPTSNNPVPTSILMLGLWHPHASESLTAQIPKGATGCQGRWQQMRGKGFYVIQVEKWLCTQTPLHI